MDDAVPIPEFLKNRPREDSTNKYPGHIVHFFDTDRQCAPGCPRFSGIRIIPDFLSPRESERLLETIDQSPFVPAQSGKLKQHYGPRINFNKQKVNADTFHGLPEYAGWIESRMLKRLGEVSPENSQPPAELLTSLETFETTDVFVLRYREENESNLDFHTDDSFAYGEVILDLSLQSDSVLTFLQANDCVRVPLPARSLAVVFGSARFDWEHAVLAYDISGSRTSITSRTLSEKLRHTEAGRQVLEVVRSGIRNGTATSPLLGPAS